MEQHLVVNPESHTSVRRLASNTPGARESSNIPVPDGSDGSEAEPHSIEQGGNSWNLAFYVGVPPFAFSSDPTGFISGTNGAGGNEEACK